MGYAGQQTGKKDTPTFAGLVLTGFTGVAKFVAGVFTGGATTTDLTEGTNLYYTQARFDSAIAAIKAVANGLASLDASGFIPIAQIPSAALERMVNVANQAARFALTIATVQLGDTVRENDTGLMYIVIDTANLGNAAGYQVYTAGSAASVAWSGVTGKPTTIAGYGITDSKMRVVQNYTTAISLTAANDVVTCNGTFTATLPTPVGNSGLAITVKNTGTGTITVATAAASIDGVATYVLNDQNESAEFISDGSIWQQF